jgi:MYND finger
MFFYMAGNEVNPSDGFSMTMQYNRSFILELWLPLLVFDVVGVVYLVYDYHVCEVSPMWIWCVFAIFFQLIFFYLVALATTIRYSYEKYRLHSHIAGVVITMIIVISGAVVLFAGFTCDNMKATGLWIWALFAFTVVTIALVYYIVMTIVEHEEVRSGRRKRSGERDYLLEQLANEQTPHPDTVEEKEADVEAHRQPTACRRPGCMKLGTVLCSACRQVSYCSTECLYQDYKDVHKYECPKMRGESTRGSEQLGLLGHMRKNSYIAK